MNLKTIKEKVRKGEFDLSEHAHKERQEEYPNDPRGPSCLIGNENLHVVCGFRSKRVLIVTNYRPEEPIWIDYKTRAKELKSRV